MELKRNNTQRLLLLLVPLAVTSIAPNPANAKSTAFSEAQVKLFDFSHNPLEVLAAIDSKTVISATNGKATAIATPKALFLNGSKPRAENSSLSQAAGDGIAYQGIAQSFAGVIGYDFEIAAGEEFSFKFDTLLKLATLTDNPLKETARASGNIKFQLLDVSYEDTFIPLNEFSIFGALNTPGKGDLLNATGYQNIEFDPDKTSVARSFGGNKESAIAKTQGTFSRFFSQKTRLMLIEEKENQAIVQAVPEPMGTVALLVTSVSMMVGGVLKRKKTQSGVE
ncbi:hypothetical protein ACKFKF_28765 [Phormidesmis sp. 146-12]